MFNRIAATFCLLTLAASATGFRVIPIRGGARALRGSIRSACALFGGAAIQSILKVTTPAAARWAVARPCAGTGRLRYLLWLRLSPGLSLRSHFFRLLDVLVEYFFSGHRRRRRKERVQTVVHFGGALFAHFTPKRALCLGAQLRHLLTDFAKFLAAFVGRQFADLLHLGQRRFNLGRPSGRSARYEPPDGNPH